MQRHPSSALTSPRPNPALPAASDLECPPRRGPRPRTGTRGARPPDGRGGPHCFAQPRTALVPCGPRRAAAARAPGPRSAGPDPRPRAPHPHACRTRPDPASWRGRPPCVDAVRPSQPCPPLEKNAREGTTHGPPFLAHARTHTHLAGPPKATDTPFADAHHTHTPPESAPGRARAGRAASSAAVKQHRNQCTTTNHGPA